MIAAGAAVAAMVVGLAQPAGAASPPPRPAAGADVDGDAIPDAVEIGGIRRADGSMAMDLAALGASPCRKSVVVEIDYMAEGDHSHAPDLFGGPPGQPDAHLGVDDTRFEDDGHNQIAVGDLDGNGRADIAVADHSEGGRVHVYDAVTHQVSTTLGVHDTRFENHGHNQIAIGDVDGQGGAEIVLADHSEGGRVHVYDAVTHQAVPGLGVADTRFNDHGHNQLAVGDVDGVGKDEIVVVDHSEGGRVHVYDAVTHQAVPGLGVADTRFNDDEHNQLVVGDVDGVGKDEIVVADASEGGRIHVYDAVTHQASPTLGVDDSTFEDDGHNQVAVGDVDGNGREEILVANDSGGRVDALDATTRRSVPGVGVSDTRFNDDDHNQLAVGDLDDGIDGRAEVMIADASEGGQVQVFDAGPPLGAVDRAMAMFDEAPVPAVNGCPYPGADTRPGIDLVVEVSNTLPEQEVLSMPEDFDAIKADPANFDPARDPYVHYNIWGHQYDTGLGPTGSSGLAWFSDDQDFLVSLGGFAGGNGTTRHQAGTFVHELGHTLGLAHGGGDGVNHKPNYLSAMNYNFQLSGLKDLTTGESLVAYSDETLPTLDAGALDEPAGVGSSHAVRTTYSDNTGKERTARADRAIDWSRSNADGVGGNNDDLDVSVRIHRGTCVGPGQNGVRDTEAAADDEVIGEEIRIGPNFVCDTDAQGDDSQELSVNAERRMLDGFDDWDNLEFANDPVPEMPAEITVGEADELEQVHDQDDAPDTTVALNTPRPGFTEPVLGVAVDERRLYATHYYAAVAEPHLSDRRGSLVVLDRATMQVTKRVPVGYHPRAVAVNQETGRIYVLNGAPPGSPNTVDLTVVDRRTLSVVTTVSLPTGQAATDVVVNERTNRVYVSNTAHGRLHVIDGATNTELPSIVIPRGPTGMAVDENTNTVYVAMNHRSSLPTVTGLVAVTDDGRTQVVHPLVDLGDPLVQPSDVAIDPLNDRIYVSGLGGNTVRPSLSILELSTRRFITRTDVVGPGRAVAVDPFAHQAFVAAQGRVDVIGEQSMTSERTIPTEQAFAIAIDEKGDRRMYTGDLRSGSLTRLAYSSGTRK
ncbi:hypothetical protein BU204_10590 [Actinophytocola xanthii]|uniref:Uncharacterized protein n=1 Tax=Actinophytocola xanthii TaxID=1912961 RepID=A0A1Q8CTF5_9PSEU|nr:hypothetical protein BU204_10590 [Actinophytocola xanthii]